MANRFQIDPADFAGLGSEWGARAHNGRGLLFDDSGYPTVDENLKEPPKVTKQPPRRLPEKPNTGLFGMIWNAIIVNPIKRFFALFSSGSVQKQEFGKLLSSPFISVGRGYEMPTLKEHRGYFNLDTIAEQEGEARVNFLYYLIRNVTGYSRSKVPDPTEIKTYGNYWEQTAVIWPEFFGDHASGLKLLIGSTPLQSFFSNCNDMSNNAYVGGVRGVFYESVEIERVDMTPFVREQRLDDTASYAFPEGLANKLKELFNSVADSPAEWLELENASLGGIKKLLGGEEFPISVPRSFLNYTDAELDKILDKKIQLLTQEKDRTNDEELRKAIEAAIADCQAQKQGKSVYQMLYNVPQQISWLARVLDEVLGSYPFAITLKDSDLIKVGDQEKKIRVPNIAEALAELQGLGIVNHAATELSINFLIRILSETGVGRMQTVKNYYLLDVLRDWLGVRTKDKNIDVQFAYDPLCTLQDDPDTSDEFARFLTPKKAPVQIEEIDEKITLRKTVQTIDQLYLMCKAYMTRKADSEKDLVKYVKEAAEALGRKTDPDEGKDDFDHFLEDIQRGGVSQPGNTLNGKTYGRDYTQRPRTRRISDRGGNP